VLDAQPPAQPHSSVIVDRPIRYVNSANAEVVGRADEQLAPVNEQLSKLEHDDAPSFRSAGARVNTLLQPSPGRPALRGLIGLLLAACIVVAAIAWQSSYGTAAKLIVAHWAPQLVSTSSLPLERPKLPAQPSPPTFQMDVADVAPLQPARLAQTASPDMAATAASLSPELAQLFQTMARDIANLEQGIEQLKGSQEQLARDNAKAVEQLKASQEQIARNTANTTEQLKTSQEQLARDSAKFGEQLKLRQEQIVRASAKASGQNPRSKTSAPPRPIATMTSKPVPTHQSPQARARPQAPMQLQPDDQ
jgi:hypothetical protein